MDLGRDVLTRTLIGSTESEEVFTPWWVTLHHYLVYTLVVLGLIAVPVNCMLSINGMCSYKYNHPNNYLLPFTLCNLEEDTGTLLIETKFSNEKIRDALNSTYQVTDIISQNVFEYHRTPNIQAIKNLKHTFIKDQNSQTNAKGCLVKTNPKNFEFYVYWKCVNKLSPIALYFPYLVLTLALILVLLERMLTRYLWTGQRIETFYNLLVKDVLAFGDIDSVDTKENRQKCQRILYDFRNSRFYCQAYVAQTAVKFCICLSVFIWTLVDQCHSLRDNFRTEFDCRVFDYFYECSIPSNGINLAIFDICNAILFVVVFVAAYNMAWHLRFYTQKHDENSKKPKGLSFLFSSKLTRLVYSYQETRMKNNETQDSLKNNNTIEEIYCKSPDMQMLLNLLVETKGIWSAILILSLFDGKFKNEFRVRDSEITSFPSSTNPRRKDVAIAWNEPMAAFFIGRNVPAEHLMYVLEIDPPVDNDSDEAIMLMPACTGDGPCVFNRIRKVSPMTEHPYPVFTSSDLGRMTPSSASGSESFSRRISSSSSLSTSTSSSSSRKSSQSQTALIKQNPDKVINIVDGGIWSSKMDDTSTKKIQRKLNSISNLQIMNRTIGLSHGRKISAEKIRNFRSVFESLRMDTDYVIRISFVLSGRKLGSESYTILSPEAFKLSSDLLSSGSNSLFPTPRTSTASAPNGFDRKFSSDFYNRSERYSLMNDDSLHQTLTEDDSNVGKAEMEEARLEEIEDEENLDSTIFSLMTRSGYFFVAHTPYQLSTALKDSPLDLKPLTRLVLLEFVARWCGLCKLIEPQLERLSEECQAYANHPTKSVLFLKADVEDCPSSAKEFGIEVLPSVVVIEQHLHQTGFYHESVITDIHIGQRIDHIQESINSWFNNDQQKSSVSDETRRKPSALQNFTLGLESIDESKVLDR